MNKAAILIVEDETIVAADLAIKLGRLGYEISGRTARGDEAVTLSRKLRPDLVLMDIRLKGPMDGVEAAEIIRRESDLPVIYLTAHSDRATLQRAKLTEPFGYILKPFEDLQLETHIEMALYKHRSQERLRLSLEAGRMGTWDWTIATGEITWNDEMFRLLGYEPGSVTPSYEAWMRRVLPEDLPQAEALLSKSLEQGADLHSEYRVLGLGDAVRWMDARGRANRDAAGRATRSYGVMMDITERKQAEETVRLQSEMLSNILEACPVPLALNDEAGNITYLNPQFTQSFGYCVEEIPNLALWWSKAYPDASYRNWVESEWRQRVDTARREQLPFKSLEVSIRCKDGSFRTVLAEATSLSGNFAANHLVLLYDITERKRILEAIQESETRLRSILTAMAEGVVVQAADGTITDCNLNAEKILGLSREQIMGRTSVDPHWQAVRTDGSPFPGEDHPAMVSLRTGRACHDVLMGLRLPDGSKKWININAEPMVKNGDTRPYAVVTSFADITTRRLMEEELLKTSERLALAAKAGGVGIWDYDVANNKLVWDEQMFRLYGITRDQFGGAYEAWQVGVHPDDRQRGHQEIQLALREENDFNTEFRVLWPDGSTHYIRAMAIVQRDASGQATQMIGTNWDITAIKQAEEMLRASEERYRSLYAESKDAIMIVWPDKGFITGNPATIKLFACRDEREFTTQAPSSLSPEFQPDGKPSADKAQEMMRLALERGSNYFEWTHRRMNGTEFPAMVLLSRIESSQERLLQATVRDITKQKQIEAELINTNRSLEQATARAELANAAKSEFLANMSHEIRTPLNGVLGMVSLLLDTKLSGEQHRYAQTARASGEALLALINDILDFSKMEAGKLELETLDFSLHSFLDDFVGMMALRSQEKQLALGCVVAPEVPSALRGDPGRLRQILINLAGNAIKFTIQGEVVIRVNVVTESANEVRLRFAVQDTGIGIPADKIGRLFGKFSQVDASTTRTYGGTGLGLAISKQLTELMGGEIGVQSEAGKGSEFWFTALLAKQPFRKPAPAPEQADLRGVRVLIVDDHPIDREILMVLLKTWGMRPSEAMDGPSALRLLTQAQAERDPFAVAILDMLMPGMDGKLLGRAIKSDLTLSNTRLVLHTSLGQTGNDQEFKEIGFAATLSKPVRRQELLDVLTAVISGKKIASSQITSTPSFSLGKNLGHVRILLAEDNVTNQQVAVGILKKLGLKVDVAANGAEAVKALETFPYDLVLMDVQMPEMDGFEATRAIRNPQSRVLNRQITIVAMTAHAMQGDREKCVQAGMDDYLAKPIERQALIAVLSKWLKPKGEVEQPVVSKPEEEVVLTNREEKLTVFNQAAFMDRVMNDNVLARTILDGFLEDLPGQITRLKNHVAAGDARLVEQQAHKIKGASATVGGEALRAVAWAMEQAGKAGDLDAARARVADLDAQFNALREALKGNR